ncbi:MAG: hypothetical protein MI741_11165 [Rhodospirillales bacterium]|nr:hypothetical protein [Rhodospirillales bacterium]
MHGLIGHAGNLQDPTQIGVISRISRIVADGLFDQGDSTVRPIVLEFDQPAEMQRVRVIRFGLENFFIEPVGLFQVAVLMDGKRTRKNG